jgi:hypothetical protein
MTESGKAYLSMLASDNMTFLGVVLTLLMVLVVYFSPRQWAVLGVMLAVCYITQGQQIPVLGFHFTTIRVVLLAGLIRVINRGEIRQLHLNSIDRCLIAYAVASIIIPTIREGTSQIFIYQLGCMYDAVLSYFVLRSLILTLEDAKIVLARMAFLIVPLAVCTVLEHITARNIFHVFGGVPEMAWMRDGHVRSMAVFRCPITAGSFGSTLGVLYLTLIYCGIHRRAALVGFAASLVIMIMAGSSGPLMGFGGGLVALGFWVLRDRMRVVRWSIFLTLLGLHLIMNAPVWFLMGRISDVVGGGGYYRAELIDQFVKSFSQWWLMGVSDTSDWMPTGTIFGGADITNQFVAVGVNGGLGLLIIYVAFIVKCFQQLGRERKAVETDSIQPDFQTSFLLWGMGATLFAHVLNLISVTYFDQMQVAWYLLIAMISARRTVLQDERITSKIKGEELNNPEVGKIPALTTEQ